MLKSFFKTGIRATYSILNNPSIICEPWSIYPARHKATGQLVSVFIFDKNKFEQHIKRSCNFNSSVINPKNVIHECYNIIKHEVMLMAKIRHPNIMTVLEHLEETDLKFIFVSEVINENLLTIIGSNELDSISIKRGLLQVCKALQFLHNNCNIVHNNLTPSSIFINSHGDWKLGGFGLLKNLNEISSKERNTAGIMDFYFLAPFATYRLEYTPPEIVIDMPPILDYANDMWCIGCLVYYLYNGGDTILRATELLNVNDYKSEFRRFENLFYHKSSVQLKHFLKAVPDDLYPLLSQIFARYPYDRLTVDQFVSSQYFNDDVVRACLFIDEFATKPDNEKITFMKGLLELGNKGSKNLLSRLPSLFLLLKLLPSLIDIVHTEALLKVTRMEPAKEMLVSDALLIILKFGSGLSSLTFQDRVYSPLFGPTSKRDSKDTSFEKLIKVSAKVRLSFVLELPVLVSKLNDKQVALLMKSIIPFYFDNKHVEDYAVDDHRRLQEVLLNQLELVIEKFDFSFIKNTLLGYLFEIFRTTNILSIKLATIKVFCMLVDHKLIDKYIAMNQLLPLLQNLKSRNFKVVQHSLKLFIKISTNDYIALDIEIIAERILSQCLSLVFGSNECTQMEFKELTQLVRSLENKLIEEKMKNLPVRKETTTERSSSDVEFKSLISSQKVNTDSSESASQGPDLKSILRPVHKSARDNKKISNNVSKSINLHAGDLKASRPKTGSPLKFGSVGNDPNFLNRIPGSYDHIEDSIVDEDFDDFKEAMSISGNNLVPPKKINEKKETENPKKTNYPPGYNSTTILMPSNNTTRSANSRDTNILDLL